MRKLLVKLVLLTFVISAPSIIYANCGNGNGNGNGCSGQTGPQGPIGPQGPAGIDGTDGVNGTDGQSGKDGQAGKDGLKGKDANVETRMVSGVVVKVAQEKYFDIESFVDYDMTYDRVGFFGMRIVIKPGKSYQDYQIEKQQKEIDALKRMILKGN